MYYTDQLECDKCVIKLDFSFDTVDISGLLNYYNKYIQVKKINVHVCCIFAM